MSEQSRQGRAPRTPQQVVREAVEKWYTATFWGSEYDLKPRLVDRVWGDGERLIWVSNMDTRPHYYVIRVDSSWYAQPNGMADQLNNGIVLDNLDDIENAIMEQFGWWDDEEAVEGSAQAEETAQAEDSFPGFPVWPRGGSGACFGGYERVA